MSSGERLTAELTDAVLVAAEAEVLLVALDFDGTLAPFVDNPADARAVPRAKDAVGRLAGLPATSVAYVSGRALESLEEVVGETPGVLLVGSHGAEYRISGSEAHPPLSETDRGRVEQIGEALVRVAGRHPGTWLEQKPAGYAFHVRGLETDAAKRASEEARRGVIDVDPDATLRDGKNVVEFSVLPATKGDGIVRLREITGATVTLYAGDDVTDEDAFAVLGDGDVSLKVGPGTTRAAYRASGPEEVARFLEELARRRSQVGPGTQAEAAEPGPAKL